jgi:hypothetical protein
MLVKRKVWLKLDSSPNTKEDYNFKHFPSLDLVMNIKYWYPSARVTNRNKDHPSTEFQRIISCNSSSVYPRVTLLTTARRKTKSFMATPPIPFVPVCFQIDGKIFSTCIWWHNFHSVLPNLQFIKITSNVTPMESWAQRSFFIITNI